MRSPRCARAGARGVAISFCDPSERDQLQGIERLIKRELPKQVVPGFEVDPQIKAEPIPNGRTQPGGGRGQGQGRGQQNRGQGQGRPGGNKPAAQGTGKPAVHRFGGRGR